MFHLYLDKPLSPSVEIWLGEAAYAHLVRVLKHRVGDHGMVFNGQGGAYKAEIMDITKKDIEIQCGSFYKEDHTSPVPIHIGQMCPHKHKMDMIIQKTTECGATSMTPLYGERTESPKHLQGKTARHWHQVMIHACQQAHRYRCMDIQPLEKASSWLTSLPKEAIKWVLHPHADKVGLKQSFQNMKPTSLEKHGIYLLIGAEGGLSPSTFQTALDNGFHPISLGPRILRTETAGMALTAIIQAEFGDWA